MRTQAVTLPGLRRVLGVPRRLFGLPAKVMRGMAAAGENVGQHLLSVLTAVEMIPRLVLALERIAPAADSLATLAETRRTLDEIARNSQGITPAADQVRALHEQVVELACDLRALEPEIEDLASTTATLDESIRVLTAAIRPAIPHST